MVAIIVLIFIAYAYSTSNTIKKLQEENKKLKKELQQININKEEKILKENKEERVQNKEERTSNLQIKKEISQEEREQRRKQKEKLEREKKNTSILITGAVLIVLAAIVFLMSTWSIIPNILKTIVMLLFIGVFLGASKIAKNNFNLEKTSLTFFYIAMAYIPIFLISCSIFELVGNFLSIRGEGKFIYLTLALFLTSLIYYLYYKKYNNKIILLGMILSQIFSVVLFTLIFAKQLIVVCMSLIIYNIVLTIVSRKNKGFEILSNIYMYLPYIIGVLSLCNMFSSNICMLILLPLLALNFFILRPYNNLVNSYCVNIAIYLLGFYITFILDIGILNENIKLIFGIIYLLVVSISNLLFMQDEEIIKSSKVVSLIYGVIFFIESNIFYEEAFIKSYVVSFILLILISIYFMRSKNEEQKVYSILIPISFIITGIDILNNFNIKYYYYIIFAIATFGVGELIRNRRLVLLNKSFFMISHIFVVLTYFYGLFYNTENLLNNIIIHLLLIIVYGYSFIKNKDNVIFKYLTYMVFGLLINSIVQFLHLSVISPLIPAIVVITNLIIENNNLKDEYSEIFSAFIQIISFISLIQFKNEVKLLLVFLYSAYLIFDNIKNYKNQYLRCIPMIGALVIFNISNVMVQEEYRILLILLSTVGLSLISVISEKLTIDTLFSGIYLINLLTYFDNEILRNVFLIIWSLINMYFIKVQKPKDVFKGIFFISVFLLYCSIIEIVGLDTYSAWSLIGITIVAIVLIKCIMKNYSTDTDNLEYIALLIIYFVALFSYSDEKDGMIFGAFLVGLLIFSYIKKYGAIFLVTLGAIIVNAILLTRLFWLLIPWWIYLLVIGSILIAFAVKNESDENKNRLNAKNIIKNIKDKIEQ